jgi:hypothetical protein
LFKRFFMWSAMASAIGVPYLISSSGEWLNSVKGSFTSSSAAKTEKPATGNPSAAGAQAAAGGNPALAEFAQPPAPTKNIEGVHTQNLVEVINFQTTPDWVTSRWPRVSTGLAHPELQGYRVPLVTGTGVDDLAGSLTYYFAADHSVQYITFHGVTGDPRKLVNHVVQKYGFQPQQTGDPGLAVYMVKWNGKPLSELRVQTSRVLRADQRNLSYKVDLALKRP